MSWHDRVHQIDLVCGNSYAFRLASLAIETRQVLTGISGKLPLSMEAEDSLRRARREIDFILEVSGERTSGIVAPAPRYSEAAE